MFEKIKKAFKAPETSGETMRREMSERHATTEEKIKRIEDESAERMEGKREEAERARIEQAQGDLRKLPEEITVLEARIKQFRDTARSNRDLAYEEQFKPNGNRGAYEQQAVVKDLEAKAVEGEKSRLEAKLYDAKILLKSRGLLEE